MRDLEKENDPLAILVMPHEVIEWHRKKGLLLKKHFPELEKKQKESGKWVIFHGKLRLTGLFETKEQARKKIREIVGNKRKCIANERIFSVRQINQHPSLLEGMKKGV